MDEYIKRENLMNGILEEKRFVFQMEDLLKEEIVVKTVYKDFFDFIKSIPAADVVPVRHGHWICKYYPMYGLTDITCSCCRETRSIEGCYEGTNGEHLWFQERFCHKCGAKMDGGGDG